MPLFRTAALVVALGLCLAAYSPLRAEPQGTHSPQADAALAPTAGAQPAPPLQSQQQDFAAALKAASQAARTAALACAERRRSGELKTHRASVECSNPKIIAAYRHAHYPFMDLIEILAKARLAGAERLDEGTVTEAEFGREMGRLAARVSAEAYRRLQAIETGQAAGSSSQSTAGHDADTLLQDLSALQPMTR